MTQQRTDGMSELSYAQEHEYGRQREKQQPMKVVQLSEGIEGPLDVPALHRALSALVRLHEALRLRVGPASDGRPMQWLADPPPPGDLLAAHRIKARSPEQFGTYVAGVRARALSEPFDLAHRPPFRFRLFRYSEQLHAFTADLPALTADRASRSLLRGRLWDAYGAALAGQDCMSDAEGEGLLAAIRRAREKHDKRSATVEHRYWARKFATMAALSDGSPENSGGSTGTSLDGPTPPAITRFSFIPGPTVALLRRTCRDAGVTFFQFALAHFARTFFLRTTRAGLAMTLPLDTRSAGERDIVGKFSRGLPILVERSEEFTTLLRRIGSDLMQTMRHQHVSYADLRRAQNLSGRAHSDGAREAIVRYTLHEERFVDTGPGGLRVTHDAFAPKVSYTCDGISFIINEYGQGVTLVLCFDPREFSVAEADRFTADLNTALSAAPRSESPWAIFPGDPS
ncbi:condensation domain-containing protein [Kitasatospora sp. NPDC087314]|uniref:condensation domain-containing protein n=1 Tax=Kitasatospora sp. NPDC087314 TaxID=3364068 RepID=UPI00380123FA